jgi:hypothetical protein
MCTELHDAPPSLMCCKICLRKSGISAPSEVGQVTSEQHSQEIVTSAAAAFVTDHYINVMI